jgi:hypothetical protein
MTKIFGRGQQTIWCLFGKLFVGELTELRNMIGYFGFHPKSAIINLSLLSGGLLKERCLLAVNNRHINNLHKLHRKPPHEPPTANGRRTNENRLLGSNLSKDIAYVEARNNTNLCGKCRESPLERRQSTRLRIHFRSLHLGFADSR